MSNSKQGFIIEATAQITEASKSEELQTFQEIIVERLKESFKNGLGTGYKKAQRDRQKENQK